MTAQRNGFTRLLLAGIALALPAANPFAAAPVASPALAAEPRVLVVSSTDGASATLSLDGVAAGVSYLAETSFGSLGSVEELTPGRYTTRMNIPPTDMPRTAVVVLSPQGREDADVAWRLLPIRVTTSLRARTEPRARVTARVGGREFGPVEAARDGSFTLDIELSPGDSKAEVRIADHAGNETTSILPVPVRAHDALTVTLDKYRVASDGTSSVRVFALAFDQAGRPIKDARIVAIASTGSLSPFDDRGDGVHVARWTPPTDGSTGVASLEISLQHAGATHHETEQVSVVRGRPTALSLAAAPMEVEAGKSAEISLTATLRDAAGHALPGQPVRIVSDRGVPSDVVDRGDGTYGSTLVAPDAVESGSIEVKALLSTGAPAKPPARMELIATPTVVPTSWRAFSLVTAKLFDADGLPVTGELVLFHLARGEGRLTPVSVSLVEGQAYADFTADPTEEAVTIEAMSTSVPSLKARVQIEKRASGQFAIITRPAQVAQGGRSAASIELADGERVLQDTVIISVRSGEPARLVATATPARLPADGAAAATITAALTDERGNEILGETLAWSADQGRIEAATSDGEGGYEATFTAPDGVGSGSAIVTVTHATSGLSASVTVALDPGPPRQIAVALDPETMRADGVSTARVIATLSDASGAPVRGVDVAFSVSSGDARVDASAMTNAAGQAVATLTAGRVPGPVSIEAEAAEGALRASAELDLQPQGPASLDAKASPESIVADGQARSEIAAELEDALGNPIEGELVEFTSSLGVLTSRQARSDAMGIARVHLRGEQPGRADVRVRSARVPTLSRNVAVTLLPVRALGADFTVSEPACSGAVTLTATSEAATTWQWDWTGDGVADATTAVAIAALSAGTQRVTLIAGDASGASATATRDIDVLASPTARASATPESAASGASVLLDAAGSAAAGGGALVHAWDLDGDGASDASGASTPWTRPDGRHVATLRVTDEAGCSATTEVAVLFGECLDLAVDASLVGGSSVVAAGEVAEFEIAWRNEGTLPATGVLLSVVLANMDAIDPIPAGGTRLSSTSLEFRLGDLATGDAGSFRVQGLATTAFAGSSVPGSLSARIESPAEDCDPADDADAAFVAIARKVDLAVSLEAAPSALPGQPVSATLTVTNLSPADASDAQASLDWDAALLLAPVVDQPATMQAGSALLNLGTLAGGASRTIKLSGSIASCLAMADPTLRFEASAWHAGPDADAANNAAQRDMLIEAQPNLAVSLTATPSQAPIGPAGTIEYRAEFRNDGAAPALGVLMTHSFAPMLVESLTQNENGGILSGNEVTFGLGTLPACSTGFRRFTVRLISDIADSERSLVNTCEVQDALRSLDPPPADAIDSVTIAVDPGAPALVVTNSLPSVAPVGGVITSVVSVTNNGARATGVELEQRLAGATLVAGTSNLPLTLSTPGDPALVRASVGSLAPGASATWLLDLAVPCPQPRVDPAVVATASALIASVPTGLPATAGTSIQALPDLSLTLAAPTSARPGEVASLTPTITNVGCAPSAGGFLDASWPSDVATGSPARVPIPALAPGASSTLAPLVVAVKPVQQATSNVVLVDAALVAADGDASASNDSARAAIIVRAAPDVRVVPPLAVATLDAGQSMDVTVTVDNLLGTTAALGVLVTLTPQNAGLISLVAPSSVTIARIDAGTSLPVTFRVTAAPVLPGGALVAMMTASAAVAGDADPNNNSADFGLPLGAAPNLAVSLAVSSIPSPAEPGALVTVEATVVNNGSVTSLAPDLRVDFDATVLALVGAGGSTIALGPIAPRGAVRRTFQFTVADPLPPGIVSTLVSAEAIEPADADASDNVATHLLPVDSSALVDVAVSLSLNAPSPLGAGDSVLATFRVSNALGRAASGVSLRATWPANLADADLSTSTPGAIGGAGSASWDGLAIAGFEPGRDFMLRLTLRDELPTVANALRIDAALVLDPVANPQLNLANDVDFVERTAIAAALPCVTLSVTTNPTPAVEGGSVTYEVTVRNDGTTAAAPTTVTLAVDPRVSAPGGAQWTLPSLGVGQSSVLSSRFTLPPLGASPTAVYSASASASAPQAVPPGACQAAGPVDVIVTRLSDLAIAKTLTSSTEMPPRRGTFLDYRVTVLNAGSAPAVIDRVVDDYPPEVQVVNAGGALDSGGTLTWTGLPVLPPLASTNLDYRVEVLSGLAPGEYLLRNVATAYNAGADASSANDSDAVDIPMLLDVDLHVEMIATPQPAPAIPGSVIAHEARITNRGAYPATNARLDIVLGSPATLSGPSPGTGTNPIDVALGTIAPGEVKVVNWLVTSAPIMNAERNAVTVTGTATSDLVDARPGDESATATTWVDAEVDLDVHSLTCTPAGGPPLSAGEQLDCVALVDNHGTLVATNVVIDVDFDADDLTVIDPGLFTPVGPARMTRSLPSLSPADPQVALQFALGVRSVLAGELNPIRTCVTASSPSPDRFTGNNNRCTDQVALAAPDLAVSLTATAPALPVTPGQVITYDLVVTNVGSTAASGVSVTDDRDESVTTGLLPGASVPMGDDGTKISIPVGTVLAGTSFAARYQVGVAATMPRVQGVVSTTACASLVETDPMPLNDCATASVAHVATTDAWVALVPVSAVPTAAGQALTLRASWGNQGTAPARSAVVDIQLDPLVDFLSCNGCTTPGPVRFALGDLATPSNAGATFDVLVKSPLPDAVNALRFDATITHADAGFEGGPGPDSVVLMVDALAWPDLVVTIARSSAPPVAGGTLTYLVTWTNTGTTMARGVLLAITDPAFTTPVGLPANAILNLGDVSPVPPSGGQMTLTYTVDATFPSTTNTLTATVALSTTTPEQGPGANAASWSDVITARPDMWTTLALAAPTAPAQCCALINTSLSYGNAGQAAAPASLRLEYDALVVDLVDGAGGTGPQGELNWSFPSLPAGFSGTLTPIFAVKCVLPALVNPLFFTSSITTPASDGDPSDNSALAQIVANGTPDLIVSARFLSATPSPAGAGSVLRFECSVENAGCTRATGVQLDARWQDPILIASAACPDDPSCSVAGSVVTWSLGSLDVAPGSAVTRLVELTVAATLPAITNTLTLTASAAALEPDSDPSTNSASVPVTITGTPDLRLTLTGAPLPGQDVTPGLAFVRYTYAIRNVGNAPAENITLSSVFDDTALSFLFGTGGASRAGNALSFSTVPSLAANTSVSPVRAALFSPNDLTPPPVTRTILHDALVQEAPPVGLSRDANAADNAASLTMRGCYLDAVVQSTALSAVCIGGSVSLFVKTVPTTGLSHAWTVDGNLGSFSSTTGTSTTYTPPITGGANSYRVHCLVTDLASGCSRDSFVDVFTTTNCSACGCRPNPVKIRYVAGSLSRVDRPGDRTVAEGETVALLVHVEELNMSRTSTLLAGRTTLTFGRPGAGPRYTATLAHDVYAECGGMTELEFTAATVPTGLVVGGLPTDYRASFSWVTLDACGNERTDSDDSGGDLITVTVSGARGASSDVTFTDWGPSQHP